MAIVAGLLLFLFQAFMLGMMAVGIGVQLGDLLLRATKVLNLPYPHTLAASAENWFLTVALMVWLMSVVTLARKALANRSADLDQHQLFAVFAPIMMLLMWSLLVAFVGGAGLLATALAHVFLDERAAIVIGLIVVALIVGWGIGVSQTTPTWP